MDENVKIQNIIEMLSCFKKIFISKKILIWGAWERGLLYQKALQKMDIEIEAFIDSNAAVSNYGSPVKKVFLPDILKSGNYFVIVSLAEHESVFQLLDKLEYTEYLDYIYPSKKILVGNLKHGYFDIYGNVIQGNIGNTSVELGGNSKIIIGDNVKLSKGVQIKCGWNSCVIIKKHTFIDENVRIISDENSYIELGDNGEILYDSHIRATGNSKIITGKDCNFGLRLTIRLDHNSIFQCGPNCLFSYDIKVRANHGHSIVDREQKIIQKDSRKTILGSHVWVGMGASILSGSEIGMHCIIGAGSVVNKKFPDYVTIAGVPAKIIKENTDWLWKDQSTYEEYELYEKYKDSEGI